MISERTIQLSQVPQMGENKFTKVLGALALVALAVAAVAISVFIFAPIAPAFLTITLIVAASSAGASALFFLTKKITETAYANMNVQERRAGTKTPEEIATHDILATEIRQARQYVAKYEDDLRKIAAKDGVAVIPKGRSGLRHNMEYYPDGGTRIRYRSRTFQGTFKDISLQKDIYTGERKVKAKILTYKDDNYKSFKHIYKPASTIEIVNKELGYERFGAAFQNPIHYAKKNGPHCVKKVSFIMDEMTSMANVITQLTEQETKAIMIGIFEKVEAMHKEGHVHRDLKPQNILIGEKDSQKTGYLNDFGSARPCHGVNSFEGTDAYVLSEMFHIFKPMESDAFALGYILYLAASRRERLRGPGKFAPSRSALMPVRPPENTLLCVAYDLMAPELSPRPTVSEALTRLKAVPV
jgi:hypothetical protein